MPLPSYTDSSTQINVELTKQIILRNAAFDLIFYHERTNPQTNAPLTWCPDSFSGNLAHNGDLAQRVIEIAERNPKIAKIESRNAFRENDVELCVQGIEFGTVAALASVLGPSGSIAQTFLGYQGRMPTVKIDKYYNQAQTAAVFACLRASTKSAQRPYYCFSSGSTRADFEGHILDALSKGKYSVLGMDLKSLWPALDTRLNGLSPWLNENDDFFSHCSSRGNPVYLPSTSFSKTMLALPTLAREMGSLKVNLETASKGESIDSARLAILDNGAMALVPAATHIGDKVCLIAGCDSSATLRRTPARSRPKLYEAIGRGFVCMSKEDAKKYEAFSERPDSFSGSSSEQVHHMRTVFNEYATASSGRVPVGMLGPIRANPEAEYDELIQKHKTLEEWRTLILV